MASFNLWRNSADAYSEAELSESVKIRYQMDCKELTNTMIPLINLESKMNPASNTEEIAPFQCRPGCAACCTVISISSPLPGMPNGKPAGIRCINLDEQNHCKIHHSQIYPDVCRKHKASLEFCGESNQEAMERLSNLEKLTQNDELQLGYDTVMVTG